MILLISLVLFVSRSATFAEAEKAVSLQTNSWNTSGLPENNSSFYTCLEKGSFICPVYNETGTCFGQHRHLFCQEDENETYISMCYCLTYNEHLGSADLGPCIFNCDYLGRTKFGIFTIFEKLPQNVTGLDILCAKFNRTGIICGECINNTYLRAYSYDLSCCSAGSIVFNWIKYIIIGYLPLTLFCLVVVAFGISIPSSKLQGYVFYCQILTSPMFSRSILFYFGEGARANHAGITIQLIGTLYGIWNLDFFRTFDLGICFEYQILTVLSLDFFVALYPLVLMVLMYAVSLMYDANWRCVVRVVMPLKFLLTFFKSDWKVRSHIIHAFGTFMYLSNVKFLGVCFDLLVPLKYCDPFKSSACHWAVFYDPTMKYFSRDHIPYVILALTIFCLFVLAPILALILYPLSLFQNCLALIPHRWKIGLHYVMDSFQGCYKDGTQPGSIDCRWFSVVPFIIRPIIFITYVTVFSYSMAHWCTIILAIVALLIIIVDPNKPQFRSNSYHFSIFILSLACLTACTMKELSLTFEWIPKVFIGSICMCNVLYIVFQSFIWIKKKMYLQNICLLCH